MPTRRRRAPVASTNRRSSSGPARWRAGQRSGRRSGTRSWRVSCRAPYQLSQDPRDDRPVSRLSRRLHRLDFAARPPLIRRSPKAPVDDLILNVDALEEANQPFEADLTREFLDDVLHADPPTEFHAAGASHLRGTATKMGRKVLIQAKFRVPLIGQCKRCLNSVRLDEAPDLIRTYVPEDQAAHEREEHRDDAAEGSFDPGLVDEETYAGKEIDLSAAVREQILLQIPSPPVCREDCPGLCAKCGKDLNEGECGCDRAVVDPRWAALKGIQ